MRILFLTTRFPFPPDRGDRLTVLNMLRTLSASHRVTFACFTEGAEPPDGLAHVQAFCERIVTVRLPRTRSWLQAWLGLFTFVPSQVSYYRSARMRAEIRELVDRRPFDVLLTHAVRGAPFFLDIEHSVKVMFQGDSVGIVLGRSIPFAPWWKRPGILWERWRVDRYLAWCTRQFTETWVLSPVDRDDILRHGGKRVETVPHGVDERLFHLVRTPEAAPHAMFLGNLSVPHNVDAAVYAAREVWPLIHAERPAARFLVVGADAVPEVTRLGTLAGVEVTGRVPDVADLWKRVHVLLAPLRFSTGIQNKVLEAMAAGVPVVTTPPVAEAIGARHGEHLFTADTPAGLARAVAETLDDPASAGLRAARAREHVRANFTWELAVRRLERLVAEHATTGPKVESVT